MMKKLILVLGLLSLLFPTVAIPCVAPTTHEWENTVETEGTTMVPSCYVVSANVEGIEGSRFINIANNCSRAVKVDCLEGCTGTLVFDAAEIRNDFSNAEIKTTNKQTLLLSLSLGKEEEPTATAFDDPTQVVSFNVRSRLVRTMPTQSDLDEARRCYEDNQSDMGQDMGVDMKKDNTSEPTASDDNLDDGCSAVGGAPAKNTSWMLLTILAFVGLFRRNKRTQG